MDTKVQLLIIIAALNILFSAFLIRGDRGLLRILFSLVVLFVGLWSLSLGLFMNTTNLDTALLVSILYYLCAAAIPLLFFYFSIVFSKNKPTISLKYLAYLLPFLYFAVSFFLDHNFIIKDVRYVEGSIIKDVVLNKQHYVYYSIYFLSYIFLSYFVLLRASTSKELSVDQRKQLSIIIFGTSTSYILAVVPNLVLPYLGNYQLIWLGPLFTILMVASIAYAILKHHLFDIKLVLVELAVLLLNMFLLFNVFTSHATADLVLNISVSAFVLFFSIILVRGIYKDIRDRERIEELAKEMTIANEKMKMMEQSKTEFVSIASHQLRTPLTVIKGYASMILEGTFGVIGAEVKDAMEKLFKSSERIVSLVEDLLTVSRLEQGRMALHFEPVNFVEFTQGVLAEFAAEMAEAGIDLVFTVEENKQFVVEIDPKKFKQVLKHILDNSIKFTRAPGGIRVALTDDSITNKIRLSISDTGAGMTEEQIYALFERFNLKGEEIHNTDTQRTDLKYGADSERPRREPADSSSDLGLGGADAGAEEEKTAEELAILQKRTPGIGLYIAKQIIDAHHGNLRIESAGVDRGTTVVVELPRGQV